MRIFITLFLSVMLISGCKENNEVRIIENKKPQDEVSRIDKKSPLPFAVAKYDCPVLNTKEFRNTYGSAGGSTLKKSNSGLVKALEFVAYPGTVFEIIDSTIDHQATIYRVKTDEYPIVLDGTDLYVDSRFVSLSAEKPEAKKKSCPPREDIYKYFEKAGNSFYVWGGNNILGVDKMFEYYPPAKKLSKNDSLHWSVTGLDCSGLLYEATNGFSPRNTHQLVQFGNAVEIKGKSSAEIAAELKPLDLIVWKGHIIIVYDSNTTIESSHSANGVVKKNLRKVLENLTSKRKPVNKWSDEVPNSFVIRRWFDTSTR